MAKCKLCPLKGLTLKFVHLIGQVKRSLSVPVALEYVHCTDPGQKRTPQNPVPSSVEAKF